MSEDERVRENRLRRMARRRGYLLQKSKRRDPLAIDFNGFMLMDAFSNAVVLGARKHAFDASIDDVEAFLERGTSERRK